VAAAVSEPDLAGRLRRWAGWIVLGVVLLGWWTCTRPRGAEAARPVDWSGEPVQVNEEGTPFTVATRKGPVELRPRARYEVAAVVAGAERYLFDTTAFLSPVDLVLTWGELPREPYHGRVSYAQMTRYYFWSTPSSELDLRYIEAHSANTHLIPANDNLRRAVLAVGAGDAVRLRGLLVDASAAGGLTWRSSLSRGDTGPGACELLYVQEVQVDDRVYR
jgi:hypothetical protein